MIGRGAVRRPRTAAPLDVLVRRHATAAPLAVALVAGDDAWTWRRLDERADRLAEALRAALAAAGARGPGPEAAGGPPLVALEEDAGPELVAALLAVLRLGWVAAPLPADRTRRERDTVLAVLRPRLVVRGGAADAPPPPAPPTSSPAGPAARELPAAAVVVLTSGTTGTPKGVILTERALAASAAAWRAVLPPPTGWALPLGLAHVAGLGVVWRAAAAGVPVRFVPPGDPAALLAALAPTADPVVTHVPLVPVQLTRLLDAAGDGPHDPAAPPTLRALLLGGGPVPASLVVRAARAGWPVVPTYGCSEYGSGITALPAGETLAAPRSAGRPLPGTAIEIDGAGPDGVGEIVVRGPAAFRGYLDAPLHPAGAPVRTGDLGRIDELGRLEVSDRRTDRIVRGGENVDPAEVEAVVAEHPAIADVAVVGRPDPVLGGVPVAAVVGEPGLPPPGDDELARFARARLAGFKVPAAWLRIDVLPRTAGGKLRREAVRRLVDGSRTGELVRPDGDAIGWRVTGDGPLQVVLLHGTLSTAAQLDRLAGLLAAPGDATVHALDRRGSGSARLARPRPLGIGVHVADLVAYLAARGIARAALVGVSFGGVLALETAARAPGLAAAVVAWEPPYLPLAAPALRPRFAALAERVAVAHGAGGPAAAAETFLRAVAGDAAWERLGPRARAFLEGEGDGALADVALDGLEPGGLDGITAPIGVLTGGASEPFYAPIADAVAARVPGARRSTIAGLVHASPIVEPAPVAAAVRAALAAAGLVATGAGIPGAPAAPRADAAAPEPER